MQDALPVNLSWLGTGIKCAGPVTQWLGYGILKYFLKIFLVKQKDNLQQHLSVKMTKFQTSNSNITHIGGM